MSSNNPLKGFWDAVAVSGNPNDQDFEAEGFPRDEWPAIRADVLRVRQLKAEGDLRGSRELARRLADSWLERLGDTWVPASSGPDTSKYGPAEWAAVLPRTTS